VACFLDWNPTPNKLHARSARKAGSARKSMRERRFRATGPVSCDGDAERDLSPPGDAVDAPGQAPRLNAARGRKGKSEAGL
jgi:hypothetical protein